MYRNNLYNARKMANKTQAELAAELKMNQNVYSRYERGDRDIPLSIAIKIADNLSVSLDYLAGRSEYSKGMLVEANADFVAEEICKPMLEKGANKVEASEISIENMKKMLRQLLDALENTSDNPDKPE